MLWKILVKKNLGVGGYEYSIQVRIHHQSFFIYSFVQDHIISHTSTTFDDDYYEVDFLSIFINRRRSYALVYNSLVLPRGLSQPSCALFYSRLEYENPLITYYMYVLYVCIYSG